MKQRDIKNRRAKIKYEYMVSNLPVTELVDRLSKKHKVSSVTVYADIKHGFNEWFMELQTLAKSYDFDLDQPDKYKYLYKDGHYPLDAITNHIIGL